MTEITPRYIDVAEVAKLVRQSFKREFPDIGFSVRSSRYAGGASVSVNPNPPMDRDGRREDSGRG